MKVKKFNNLWTMGLILFGAILIAFYVLKIVYPEFIVGVAETPAIVNFGVYVDTHLWAYYLFTFIISFIGGYFYYCACLRTYKLNLKQILIVILFIISSMAINKYQPKLYTAYNYSMFIFIPFVLSLIGDNKNIDIFKSTAICFTIDLLAQLISLIVRDIVLFANTLNSATLIILMVDAYIWRLLLYCYFNFKRR